MLRALAALITPRCVACRGPAGRYELLCVECRLALPWLEPPLCPACGLPEPCGVVCPAAAAAFGGAFAPVGYEGPVPALIRALKEDGAIPVADLMAAAIVAGMPDEFLDDDPLVVPVPADPWRARRRGIDHADAIARAVARRARLRHGSPLSRRHRRRQAGRSRAERLGAGPELGCAPVSGRILLVDDVHTTGATLDQAACVLLACGADEVLCLTFGRAT